MPAFRTGEASTEIPVFGELAQNRFFLGAPTDDELEKSDFTAMMGRESVNRCYSVRYVGIPSSSENTHRPYSTGLVDKGRRVRAEFQYDMVLR